jgi:membrane fusion protein, multidrug efflux system
VNNTVALRPVQVMRYNATVVIIAAGLQVGEVVVTAGVNVLYPGQKVSLLSGS